MSGTLAISWGAWCRPYIFREGYCRRIVIGPLALTHIPNVEIEDLMEAYVQREQMTDALASIRVYSEAGQDGTHKSWGNACGEDSCLVCLIEGTAAEAIAITTKDGDQS